MARARTLLMALSVAVLSVGTPGCVTGLLVDGIDNNATSPSARMAANVGLGLLLPIAAAIDFVALPIELAVGAIIWFFFPPFI